MMAYKVLDLFSGAGGLSRGFYDAGYDVVLGVDFDEAALKTFKANHGKAEAITCEEAIGDLPSLQKPDGEIIYGEDFQDYVTEPQNDYQKKMRERSVKVMQVVLQLYSEMI